MSNESNRLAEIVLKGAQSFGLTLSKTAISRFQTYFEFLESEGKDVNLTALKGADSIATLHFLDSLALFGFTDFLNSTIIDIGSGAGFPGLPLKIADSSVSLTLLDSAGKRISFLTGLLSKLDIEANPVLGRAEELSHEEGFRESFDIAVTRAVARLNVLAELCLPYVKIGGSFLSMKAANCDDEINEAVSAITALGGSLCKCEDYRIPETDVTHRVVIIKKTSKTPDKYPRRFAKMQKSPL